MYLIRLNIALLCCLLSFHSSFAQPEIKFAVTAKNMIGKTDVNSKKLNTLKSWDAVKYCAKMAGIISQSQSNSLNSMQIISIDDQKATSMTRIPRGHIIGFFDAGGRLKHCMISSGNGKAIGVKNRIIIGIGQDNKWEEISLQTLAFKIGTGRITVRGKQFDVRHKPVSQLLNKDYHSQVAKNQVYTREGTAGSTQSSVPVQYNSSAKQREAEDKLDQRVEFGKELGKYEWSKISATSPDLEYEKHKKGFPQLKTWQQYAAKAIDMKKRRKLPNGSEVYVNRNIIERKYGGYYLFDKTNRIMLLLDQGIAPVSMQKMASLTAFNQFFTSEVKWDSFSGQKDAVKNARNEFNEHKKDFNFQHWDAYAFHAQTLIEDVAEKAKRDDNILVKRIEGDLMYFNQSSGVFIAANRKNHVITMLKPDIGIQHYYYFTQDDGSSSRSGSSFKEYDQIPQQASSQSNARPQNSREGNYSRVHPENYENVNAALDGVADNSRKKQKESVYDRVNLDEDSESSPPALPPEPSEDAASAPPPEPGTDPSVNHTNWTTYKTTDWAKKGNLPAARAASLVYRKHSKDFPRGTTLLQYIAIANNFIKDPPSDAITKVRDNGDLVIYHEASGLLGIYNQEKQPKSLFKAQNRQAFDEL